MRAVQAYLNLKARDLTAFRSEFDLLVWKLSVVRNKKLGFTTVLYTVKEDEEILKTLHISDLYDEVYYLDLSIFHDLDLNAFWAFIKFAAIERELDKGEDFFIVDTDLVFMNSEILSEINKSTLFWLDAEPFYRYVSMSKVHRPKGFLYPRWIDVNARPINTAIIRIADREAIRDWLDLAWRFARGNKEFGIGLTEMITVEQRFVASVLQKHHLPRRAFATMSRKFEETRRNFGASHFHIWGLKHSINMVDRFRRKWIKTLLLIIQQESPELYQDILDNHGEQVEEVLGLWDSIPLEPALSHYLNKETV